MLPSMPNSRSGSCVPFATYSAAITRADAGVPDSPEGRHLFAGLKAGSFPAGLRLRRCLSRQDLADRLEPTNRARLSGSMTHRLGLLGHRHLIDNGTRAHVLRITDDFGNRGAAVVAIEEPVCFLRDVEAPAFSSFGCGSAKSSKIQASTRWPFSAVRRAAYESPGVIRAAMKQLNFAHRAPPPV